MRIEPLIRVLTAASLLLLLPFVHATAAEPVSDPASSNSDTPAQPPSEAPTTQPGEKSAVGGDNSEDKPFVPSESVPAGSAVKFPVDI